MCIHSCVLVNVAGAATNTGEKKQEKSASFVGSKFCGGDKPAGESRTIFGALTALPWSESSQPCRSP